MVTIAFGIIVFSVLMEWTAFTGGPLGITAIPKLHVGGFVLGGPWFYVLCLACLGGPPRAATHLLRLEGLGMQFGGLRAVDGLDLEVRPGAISQPGGKVHWRPCGVRFLAWIRISSIRPCGRTFTTR